MWIKILIETRLNVLSLIESTYSNLNLYCMNDWKITDEEMNEPVCYYIADFYAFMENSKEHAEIERFL